GMGGEYEDGGGEGPVVAPPAGPRLLPGTPPATEHLAAHDVRPDALEEVLDDLGVGIVLAVLEPVLGAPAVGCDSPVVQTHSALSDRVLNALVWPRDETV